VLAVKKVSDIISEISAASDEQATGIAEVNKAIVSMDEMTQQNAALVEKAAAAGKMMNEQAISMNSLMDLFEVGSEHPNNEDLKPSVAETTRTVIKKSAPSLTKVNKSAPQSNKTDDDAQQWDEF